MAVSSRTLRQLGVSIRGLSVDFVRGAFSLLRATRWAPGTPVGGQPSMRSVVVHKSPQHEWSPAAAAALDEVRKRLGVPH
jgi:hypothetical protein